MPLVLTKATDTQIITALDQKGNPYLGDLSATTVTTDKPDVVAVALSAFVNGMATLTETQGTEGTANITIANGTVSVTEAVESYSPVLTSFTVGDLT